MDLNDTLIPPILCKCGCGRPAPVSPKNDRGKGRIKGRAMPYRQGHHPRAPLAKRFWSKVDMSGGPDACWTWMATKDTAGYGRIMKTKGTTRLSAHRVAYELTYGPIPDDMCVCHACDNPPCCNPAHLWLGTSRENIADRQMKGRQSKHEGRPGARITMEIAARIREEYAAGGITHRGLGKKYGLERSSITYIISRKTWRD